MMIDNLKLILEFKHLLSNVFIHLLLWMAILDVVTGLVKGVWFQKEGNSTKALHGIIKHSAVIVATLILYPYAILLGQNVVANSVVCGYIAAYALSLIENLGQMGIWVPQFLKERLTKLKNSSENNENTK